MSQRHKEQRRANLPLTREQREAAVESVAAMFPSDFRWVAETLLECLEIEKLEEGWCFECGGPGKLRSPNYGERRKTLQLLLEHRIGKPVERRQVDVTTRVIKKREELEALSDEELLQIEEGEWKQLPSKS